MPHCGLATLGLFEDLDDPLPARDPGRSPCRAPPGSASGCSRSRPCAARSGGGASARCRRGRRRTGAGAALTTAGSRITPRRLGASAIADLSAARRGHYSEQPQRRRALRAATARASPRGGQQLGHAPPERRELLVALAGDAPPPASSAAPAGPTAAASRPCRARAAPRRARRGPLRRWSARAARRPRAGRAANSGWVRQRSMNCSNGLALQLVGQPSSAARRARALGGSPRCRRCADDEHQPLDALGAASATCSATRPPIE